MSRCNHCGAEAPENASFCPTCGKRIESGEILQNGSVYEADGPSQKLVVLAVLAAILVVAAAAAIGYFAVLKPKLADKLDIGPSTEDATLEDDAQAADDSSQDAATDANEENKTNTTAEYPKAMYVNAEEGLILRSGPGTDKDMIYLMAYGDEIQVEKTENGWAYTTVKGNSGWCSMDYLSDDKSVIKPKETKTTNVDPKKLVAPENTADQGYHGYVFAKEGVNMRYGPGTQYDIITALPYNAEAIERGWQDGWIYIEYKGTFGWVSGEYFGMVGGREKPVIYLYPTKKTDVRVEVILKDGHFIKTIPESDGVWNVTADPSGRLTNKANGKVYDYIFWESSDDTEYDWSEGYVVAGYESEKFLNDILPKMGLSEKETEDFIDYWLPRLEKNSFNQISFQSDCYTDAVELKVSPKADSMLRIFMTFRELKEPIAVPSPKIETFDRKGFTVIEWGGAEKHGI